MSLGQKDRKVAARDVEKIAYQKPQKEKCPGEQIAKGASGNLYLLVPETHKEKVRVTPRIGQK
jgi:hypothetical protein